MWGLVRAAPSPRRSPQRGEGEKRAAFDTVHNGFLASPGWCGASCALPPHPDPLPKGARGKNVLHLIPCIMVFLHCRAGVGSRARCPSHPDPLPKGARGKNVLHLIPCIMVFLHRRAGVGSRARCPPHPGALPKGARGKNVLHLIPCIMVFLHRRAGVGSRARCPLTPTLSPKGRGGKRATSDTVHNGFLALLKDALHLTPSTISPLAPPGRGLG